jgi:hypothetical protein
MEQQTRPVSAVELQRSYGLVPLRNYLGAETAQCTCPCESEYTLQSINSTRSKGCSSGSFAASSLVYVRVSQGIQGASQLLQGFNATERDAERCAAGRVECNMHEVSF